MILGQDRAVGQFRAAWDSRALHHAWLLAGPQGVGKSSFARAAVTRVLADAAGPCNDLPGLEVSPAHPMAKLIEAGSHPDLRWLERLENPKTGNLSRNISVDQVRSLADLFGSTPFMSPWRCVVIDAVDDLETSGANALLKMLEEPPGNCLFLLVSHAPGRLLPTIRSRCRRLDFQRLDAAAMTSLLAERLPDLKETERARLGEAAGGSPGRAIAFAELDLAKFELAATKILREGDPSNALRCELAAELGRKGGGDRYLAFLQLAPALVAREAKRTNGAARHRALEAYSRTRELAALAPRLSLDPAATIFQLGGILASVAQPLP